MVPDSCKFDHIHDQDLCMSHDQWRERAEETCSSKYGMNGKDYGILLSCKTDLFTGELKGFVVLVNPSKVL